MSTVTHNPGFDDIAVGPVRRPLWNFLARHGVMIALALSVFLHILGWLIAHFVHVGGLGGGGGDGGGGPVEFAVMTETELAAAMQGTVDLQTPSVPEATAHEPVPSEMITGSAGDDTGVPMGEGAGIGSLVGGGDIGGDGTGMGGGEGLGGVGGGGASFFGVEAKGNRFAYVVDISGSMGVGGKIEALRNQLKESIGGLTETSQFLVIPFSSGARAMGDRKEWVEASTPGKKWARSQIDLLGPEGGTEPLPGFQMAFSMKPRPDAIYFMTDGEFDPSVAEEIALMNKQLHVPIHCICFTSRESEEWMKKIAKQSRGTYTFIAGP